MSRLVCFDLTEGRRLHVQGVAYRVRMNPLAKLTVTLERDSDGQLQKMSRNELAALIVLEQAELLDDLEEPEPVAQRIATDISHLPLHRMLDWQAKLFVLTWLMPMQHASPRGTQFRARLDEAYQQLRAWRESVGLAGGKEWSAWTLYHDLLRWRKSRYAIGALQKKGVEYSPWGETPPLYREAARIAKEAGLAAPHLSATSVHELVDKELRRKHIGEAG